MSTLSGLDKKSINIENVARKALKDKEVLSELLEGVLSRKERIRFNCFNVLLYISEKHPKALYPKWDFFKKLLASDNTYFKYIAIHIITNLAKIDEKNKFEKIYEKFYNLLDDKSLIPASHVAGNSGKIVNAKPKLKTRITNRLLSIDKTHHSPERRDLIKSYAIESFDQYFKEAKDKKKILEFVKKQLNAKSPKTKKIAKRFLKKWEK
ncbi:MAG: hypothetical protein AMJ90_01025 [candidate division Zixibacteria bacterium SM23_73_2]|nr:MAG: hypothetical protein AMJ90_01025 [candidate division Zixibacteria bacterium SM23_73_2]